MLKSFVYKLYPTITQIKSLEEMRETCRRWYNNCLAERKTAYEEEKKTVSKVEQLRHVKDYRVSNEYAAKVHSHVLQNVVADLDKSFKAFFGRVKAGETPGYPRFKGRNRFRSFGFKEYGNGFKIDGRRLKLFGIGRVAVRWHRPIEGIIKTVRIIKKAGDWYACFSCLIEIESLPREFTYVGEPANVTRSPTGDAIGVDVGVSSLISTSTGEKVDNPKWYQHEQRQLRVLQRRVSRCQKGSNNRRKAVLLLQKQHEKIANRRRDFLNKLAIKLIRKYDVIVLEDLQIKNMVRNHHLAKSILDSGWGYLVHQIANKAVEAGREVKLVNPAYSSKSCSGCGAIFENLTLKDRWIECSCGISLDRDHNAAINLLNRAGHVLCSVSSSVDGLLQEAAPL